MNTERLEKMIEMLHDIPKARFDMANWVGNDCGTVACAIGHAAQHPWFRKQGLHLSPPKLGEFIPLYKRRENWEAVTAFFDIKDEDAEYLFDGWSYASCMRGKPGPAEVIARIRELLENGDNEDWRKK